MGRQWAGRGREVKGGAGGAREGWEGLGRFRGLQVGGSKGGVGRCWRGGGGEGRVQGGAREGWEGLGREGRGREEPRGLEQVGRGSRFHPPYLALLLHQGDRRGQHSRKLCQLCLNAPHIGPKTQPQPRLLFKPPHLALLLH